ncbi:MAG: hypothetical protein LBR35_02650, partial [Rickettsiales bacterium]|nr:hypothetical protein [Rickettsiales bacterium]
MIISGIFFSNGIRTGGHTRYIELLEGLAAKGHTVYLYYNDELSLNTKHVQLIPVSVHYVYHKTKRLGSLFAKKLREYIKRRSAIISDYVLVFGETNWKAAHILSGKVNAKILFAFRSDGIQEALMYLKYEKLSFKTYLFQIAYMFRQFIREKSIAKKAAIIFFQSKYDENNFLKRNLLCKAKTKVVRGDIRQDRFLKEYAFSNTSVHCSKLLFVGNFGLRKGLSYLLEAVLKLEKQDGFDFSLTIIGPDSEENPLNDFLKKNNLHSIQYLG